MKKSPAIDPLIGKSEWGKALGGRCTRTVDNLIRRRVIPPPDLYILGRPQWRASTYEATLQRLAGDSVAASNPDSVDAA